MAIYIGTYGPQPPQGSLVPNPDRSIVASTVVVGAGQPELFKLLMDDEEPRRAGALVGDRGYQPDRPDGYSALGTPVYGRIILGDPGGALNRYTDAQGVARSYTTVVLDCAVVDIGYDPRVIQTNIQGLNYSIKEYISSGDNRVSITGRYDSTPDVAPRTFTTNLNSLFSAQTSIPVTNTYLNDKGITHIVIMPGTRMGQVKGEYSSQQFTIEAVSDVPLTSMLP